MRKPISSVIFSCILAVMLVALPVDVAFAATTSSSGSGASGNASGSSSNTSTFNGTGTYSGSSTSASTSTTENASSLERKYSDDLTPSFKTGNVFDHEYTPKAWDEPAKGKMYKPVASVEYMAWTPTKSKSGTSSKRFSKKYIQYDENGNPINIDLEYEAGYNGNSSARKYSEHYTYDEFGNQLSRVDSYTNGTKRLYDIEAINDQQYDDDGHILSMKLGAEKGHATDALPESDYKTDVSFNYYDTGVLESMTTDGKSAKYDETGRVVLGKSHSSYSYEDDDAGFATKCSQTMSTGSSSGSAKTVVGEFEYNEQGDRTVEKTTADTSSGVSSSEYHYTYNYAKNGQLLSFTVKDGKGKKTSELIRTKGDKTGACMDVRRVYGDDGKAVYVRIDIVEQQSNAHVPFAYRPVDESPEMALAEEGYFVHIGLENPFQTLRMTDADAVTLARESGRVSDSVSPYSSSSSSSSSKTTSSSSSRNSNSCGSTFGIFILFLLAYGGFRVFAYLKKEGYLEDINKQSSATGDGEPGQTGSASPTPPPSARPSGVGGQGAPDIGKELRGILGQVGNAIDKISDAELFGSGDVHVSPKTPPRPSNAQINLPEVMPNVTPEPINVDDLDAESNPIIQAAMKAAESTAPKNASFAPASDSSDDWDADEGYDDWDADEDEDYDDWDDESESSETSSASGSSPAQTKVFVGVDANGNFKPTGNKIIDDILRGYVEGNGDTKNDAN